MRIIEAKIAKPGDWESEVDQAKVIVMLQAQIGGEHYSDFKANNICSTELVLKACRRNRGCYLVHISSSVVNSMAVDFYTESKKAQEKLVRESGVPHCVLRPTLMFGWFDRKHLGWLSRFMQRVPVFPYRARGGISASLCSCSTFAASLCGAFACSPTAMSTTSPAGTRSTTSRSSERYA